MTEVAKKMLHHYHQIHPRLRGVRGAPAFPAGSLSPAQILSAYGFRQNQYAGARPIKLGIGSLGGGVVQADIDASVRAWGMLAPKLTIRGVDDPADQNSNVENMLDIVPTMAFTWWWLTGTPADITISFGPNAAGGMEHVTRDLVAADVKVASWSWGSAASSWDPAERKSLAKAFADAAAAGVTFCAASGDNSIDDGTQAPSADYPASDPNVWAVGGTLLVPGVSESAWGDGKPGDSGGGGGFDPTVPTPLWQHNVGRGRGVPDTSANADPNSGWQMSANGSWTVVGGTSAASPFTAALIAVARGLALVEPKGAIAHLVYEATFAAMRDILKGSNGDPAAPGWDPATGLGTPNGDAFIRALTGAPMHPTPPKTLTLAQAQAVLAAGWPK
jgi:kumamolisin